MGGRYANRTDLQKNTSSLNQTAPSTGYGNRKAQQDALRAVPMSAPSVPPPVPSRAGAAGGGTPSLGPFDRPTERPQEPLTAGLPFGAGPGPEALQGMIPTDTSVEILRAAYLRYPSDDLRDLLEELESG